MGVKLWSLCYAIYPVSKRDRNLTMSFRKFGFGMVVSTPLSDCRAH
jgi:hypothetical protein